MGPLETSKTLPPSIHRFFHAVAAAEREWPWLLAACTAALLAGTILLDFKRPFWNDELFTFYISRQPTLHDVWRTLLTGAEQVPPSFFAIVRSFTSVLGENKVGYRLPETLGFVVMSVSAFFFVRRRTSTYFGLVAFMFPSLTAAYYYAYEARAYGVVMGFSGLAVIFWQAAAEGRHRPLSLIGLMLSLACAVSCHYYAILIFFPFVVSEIVRLLGSKRADIAMYSAIAAAVFPFVLFLPLIRAASGYSSKFWAKPQWSMVFSFYENLLSPAGLALLLIALLAGLSVWLHSTLKRESQPGPHIPAHELALAAGFTLIPLIAIVSAKFMTGAFTARYATYSVFGLSILLAWSLAWVGRRSYLLGSAAVAVCVSCWLVMAVRQYRQFQADAAGEVQTFNFLESQGPGTPVVIASPHLFFVLSHKAAIEGRGHFTYLADVPLAVQYTETDTVERGLLVLRDLAPIDVQDFHHFAATHRRFLVYGFPDPYGWVLQETIRTGRPVSVRARNGDSLLYEVGSRGPTGLASTTVP